MSVVTIRKKVFFYHINLVKDGRLMRFPHQDFTAAIERLSPEDKYIDLAEHFKMFCLTESSWPHRLRFFVSKRADFPVIDYKATVEPLSVPLNGGLSDCTHAVIFEGKYLGIIVTDKGPRHLKIRDYMRRKFGKVQITPCLRRDVWSEVNKLQFFEKVRVKIRPSKDQLLFDNADRVGTAFEVLEDETDAFSIDLVLSANPYQKSKPGTLNNALALVNQFFHARGIKGDVKKLKVEGRANENSASRLEIDMFSDQFTAGKYVNKAANSSRNLEDLSAYQAIEGAYQDLRAEIHASSSFTVTVDDAGEEYDTTTFETGAPDD